MSTCWVLTSRTPLTERATSTASSIAAVPSRVTSPLLASTVPGGPAAAAGLRQSDVILAYDQTRVEDYHHVQRLTAETKAGTKVVLQVLRKKQKVAVTVTVAEAPDDVPRRPAGPTPKN